LVRGFLAFNAFIWFPYGLYLFAAPGALESIAGVAAASATGTVEIRAMYGGLQMAIGVLCGGAALRPSLERPALTAVAFLTAGLFMTRCLGALWAMEVSQYTAAAALFEIVLSTTATRLLVIGSAAGD
jgi:hypothetical protein